MAKINLNSESISIIIPNINGIEHLKVCIPSVYSQSYSNYNVIIIDNGSTDNSIQYIKDNFPFCEIIAHSYNTGFAKAVNDGIKFAMDKFNSEFILLLNNDIELERDFLEKIIDTFNSNSEASIVAVKMMNFYNRDTIDDTGNFLTRKGGTAYPRGNGQKDEGQFDKPEFIFGACAGAAFYRAKVFKKAGLFDEKFFAYLEDIDLSFRLQLAGFKCYYQPQAVCYHKRGGSSVSSVKFQAYMNERNIIWVRIKNYSVKMYLQYQLRFMLSRLIRFKALYIIHGFSVFFAALKGYITGILTIPFMLGKRIKIQKNKIVSDKYISSLFR